jgi:hypothetical protein
MPPRLEPVAMIPKAAPVFVVNQPWITFKAMNDLVFIQGKGRHYSYQLEKWQQRQ